MNFTQEMNAQGDIIFENFQIFGSEDSKDYDIMVFVDEIGTKQESHERVAEFDRKLSLMFPDKPLNSNLAIIKYGVVTEVFKGTVDEVNNMLYLTYNLHEQKYPLKITRLIERDVDLKILRTARVLLSFLSRTEHRPKVKKALKSDLIEKLKVLADIDLTKILDLGSRNVKWEDYLKTMSFQLGQTLALMVGKELYTKNEIFQTFPELKTMLLREDVDLFNLEVLKNKFITDTLEHLPLMTNLIE